MADTIGNLNPMRYRGYYYDNESGYYYLQSRYYDSNTCRFINADESSVLKLTKGDAVGHNLFEYCGNNPIRNIDPTGYSIKFGKTINLGKGWYARFDKGLVGNKDHVHVWNGNSKWAIGLDGSNSHDGSSNSGTPPTKTLKKLKDATGFDYEKAYEINQVCKILKASRLITKLYFNKKGCLHVVVKLGAKIIKVMIKLSPSSAESYSDWAYKNRAQIPGGYWENGQYVLPIIEGPVLPAFGFSPSGGFIFAY